ncbi:MAG: cob(I)yrinic acid a,c-diamide adenosyltransferase [Lentimicrobiaceae bacterium]|nr:cob(I)yrinic acid a,c-diamide adenosyltransferase [Lentimicrobiaceae bacterium]
MSIYTKTGDDGTTSLANGVRVSKNHIRVESYGTIDELNAHTALLEAVIDDDAVKKELHAVQDNLFIIQTHLAADDSKPCPFELPDLQKLDCQRLEREIDFLNKKLPKLHSFVYLGGHSTAAQCHIARCVCRRAERILATLSEKHTVDARILCYINRLSDYLFVLARNISTKYQS